MHGLESHVFLGPKRVLILISRFSAESFVGVEREFGKMGVRPGDEYRLLGIDLDNLI